MRVEIFILSIQKTMNYEKFTTMAQEALQEASELAIKYDAPQVTWFHLLEALLQQNNSAVRQIMKAFVDDTSASSSEIKHYARLWDELRSYNKSQPTIQWRAQLTMSQWLQTVLIKSQIVAEDLKDTHVSCEHLLLALIKYDSAMSNFFSWYWVTYKALQEKIQSLRAWQKLIENDEMNWNEVVKDLSEFGIDITAEAAAGKMDPIIWRDDEIRRMMQILSRRMKNNPVLVGDPWVWKTALVEWIAQRIVKGEVPDTLKDKKIFELRIGDMMAWTQYRWAFEQKLKKILETVEKSNGQVILFIDELHTIVWAWKTEWSADMGNMLKPALARGKIRVIGATTLNEYRKYIEKDPALERRFQPVLIDEPHRDDAISILRGIKPNYERHHGVNISDAAVVAAVDLSTKYVADRFLPDKAIDLMDEATAAVKMWIVSMPAEIVDLERRIRNLEVEKEALSIEMKAKKTDEKTAKRIRDIEQELASCKEQYNALTWEWEHERKVLIQVKEMKEQVAQLEHDAMIAEKDTDYNKVAEIRYGKIPTLQTAIENLEKRIEEARQTWQLTVRDMVMPEDVAQIVAKWTWIPAAKLVEKDIDKLTHLEEWLQARVIGQDDAVWLVANAIRRSRAWLQDPNRPIWSFIFAWPTWVGKTELAKSLAEYLFNDRHAMVRIDMSEYMEKHAVARMIWSPPGYVGYDEWGQLTEAVRRKPYSVILFDEIEKAHPDVFNVLLQILDDGRLTDAKGRTVNFKNTIIIMTTNLWSDKIMEKLETGLKQAPKGTKSTLDASKQKAELYMDMMQVFRGFFRPEFLNRVDDIVLFNPINQDILRQIVHTQLVQLISMVKKEKDIILQITDTAKVELWNVGFDPTFGARPLKRAIQKYILDSLAVEIIKCKVQEGNSVTIDYKDWSFVIA
jgi:ATP-dependent Clp protease ATP-binding subunit ClpB